MDEDLAAASHPNGGSDPKQGFGEMRATVSAGTAAHYHTRCPRILFVALVSPDFTDTATLSAPTMTMYTVASTHHQVNSSSSSAVASSQIGFLLLAMTGVDRIRSL